MTQLVCAPWVTIADLPASRPTLDDDTWGDLLMQASEMLYVWSGRQFSGDCASTVVLEHPPGAEQHTMPFWRYWDGPWLPPWPAWDYRGVRDEVVARLPDPPVTAISSLTIDDVEQVPDVDYIAELPAGLIWRTQFLRWPLDGTVKVSYTHGALPPIGGKRATVLLAVELGKSWAGQKCNLPRRIETIAREGINISLATSLGGWRTGIWDIDAWLDSVNPSRLSKRASAWSPDSPHARRVIT